MRRMLGVALLFMLYASPAGALPSFFGGPQKVTAVDGRIIVDVSKLKVTSAEHYLYRAGGNAVRFFVARDGQGKVRVAADACEVCRDEGKGYTLKDGAMLCLNCGRRFPLHRIGILVGGCNPHPLNFAEDGSSVVLTVLEVLSAAEYFPENRK
ncbi:MAG: DUF2318 domain-containing protein [Desulfovibrio sp.]|nr:DUF2318 domain-containing protein [Desulfovibrio sp.]